MGGGTGAVQPKKQNMMLRREQREVRFQENSTGEQGGAGEGCEEIAAATRSTRTPELVIMFQVSSSLCCAVLCNQIIDQYQISCKPLITHI